MKPLLALPLLFILSGCATNPAITVPASLACTAVNYESAWLSILDGLLWLDETIDKYQDKPQSTEQGE